MWDYFLIDRHLDEMMTIVADLGDSLANVRSDLPGGNSPYQLVFHCCGVAEWWTRSAVLGLPVERDRAAEFEATGTVAELQQRVDAVVAHVRADLAVIDPDAPLRGDPSADYVDTPIGRSARGVLLHVLEELAQHHGQLELTRDAILAARSAG
ncbi:MAG: hypothetical protein QOJ03_33 [Frankiaceae bacterium]|nr:hypothetical protein [Frankiaceae bacterium]